MSILWHEYPLGLPTKALSRYLYDLLGDPSTVAARAIARQRQLQREYFSKGWRHPERDPAIVAARCEISRAITAPRAIPSLSKLMQNAKVRNSIRFYWSQFVETPDVVLRIINSDNGELLRLLMDHHCIPERFRLAFEEENSGRTWIEEQDSVMYALNRRKTSVLEVLLERGGTIPPSEKDRALSFALNSDSVRFLKAVMELGGVGGNDPDELNVALFRSCQNHSDDTTIMEYLITKGADVNAKCSWPNYQNYGRNMTCLMVGFGKSKVSFLLQHGADVRARSSDGSTVLHYALTQGNIRVMRQLLAAGAEVNAKSSDGKTPLHCWIERIVKTRAGVDIQDGITPLLLEFGADVGLRDQLGRTPLHYAVQCERPFKDTVLLLLQHNSDPNAVDSSGQTPVYLAATHISEYARGSNSETMEVLRILLDHGGH
ncbi:hypothetical protein HDU93_000835, partial [Gonapodya sp. JEL0774]